MRTVVITGGTDGMGAALARHFLTAGDRVIIIGRSRAKFDGLLSALGDPSAADQAEFVAADLSLLADGRAVVAHLTARYEQIDALVLAASFIRSRRHLTVEGHEASWALFFLSKYILVTGLAEQLRASARPVVVNTSVPGAKAGAIDFDDPELMRGFTFGKSNAQQKRANELLGILATRDNPDLSYVTWGPARLVRSSFAGDVGIGMKLASTILAPLLGQRPADAVRPLTGLIDNPAPGRAAYRGPEPVPLVESPRDAQDATRLADLARADEKGA